MTLLTEAWVMPVPCSRQTTLSRSQQKVAWLLDLKWLLSSSKGERGNHWSDKFLWTLHSLPWHKIPSQPQPYPQKIINTFKKLCLKEANNYRISLISFSQGLKASLWTSFPSLARFLSKCFNVGAIENWIFTLISSFVCLWLLYSKGTACHMLIMYLAINTLNVNSKNFLVGCVGFCCCFCFVLLLLSFLFWTLEIFSSMICLVLPPEFWD